MSIQADVLAGILATLVDPRTSDEDLAKVVAVMGEHDVREALTAIAAWASGTVTAAAAHSGCDVDDVMRMMRGDFLLCLLEVDEEENHE